MGLRNANQRNIHIEFNARQGFLNLALWNEQTATSTVLSPQIPIQGLQTGREIKIAAAVDSNRYTVFLDGKRVVDHRTDEAGSGASDIHISALGCNGGTGTLRITGARVYALAPGNDSR